MGPQSQRSELPRPLGGTGSEVREGAPHSLGWQGPSGAGPGEVRTWCCWQVTWHRVSGGSSHRTWAGTATSRPSSSITHSLWPGPSWGRGQRQQQGLSRAVSLPAASLPPRPGPSPGGGAGSCPAAEPVAPRGPAAARSPGRCPRRGRHRPPSSPRPAGTEPGRHGATPVLPARRPGPAAPPRPSRRPHQLPGPGAVQLVVQAGQQEGGGRALELGRVPVA